MFKNHVKLDDELYSKAKQCADLAGYSSVEEFVQHVVEKEIRQILGSDAAEDATPEEIKKRLQGLGYIE